MVYRPARAREQSVQHPGGPAAERSVERHGAPAGPSGRRRSSRRAPHDLLSSGRARNASGAAGRACRASGWWTCAASRNDEVRRLAIEEAQRPFDLSRGPLLRASLVQLSSDESCRAVRHAPHRQRRLVGRRADERVLDSVRRVRPRRTLEVARAPVQYADFAIWQRRWLAGPVLDAQLSYWQRQLELAPPDSRSAYRRAHGRRSGPIEGALASRALPRPLCDRLLRLARQERVTSFMMFLAAFQVLLEQVHRARRCGGRDDDRQPDAIRARRADRLLRQHPGTCVST